MPGPTPFDAFGSVIQAGAGLLGTWMTNRAQAAANQQNLQQAQAIATGQNLGAYYSNLVGAAKNVGLSPLALLGQSTPSATASISPASMGQGVADFGQNIGRAVSQLAPQDDELRKLQLQRMKLENYGLSQDIAHRSAIASAQAVQHGQPGNVTVAPEGFRKGTFGVPMYGPMYDPGGNVYDVPTRDFSTRSFGSGGEPSSRAAGDLAAIRNAARAARNLKFDWGSPSTFGGPFQLGPITVRPDIGRKFQDRLPWED